MRVFIILIISFFHAIVFAADDWEPSDYDPIEQEGNFVYWASSINPTIIFNQGIEPTPGQSDNLQRIALNVNCLSTHAPENPDSSALIVGTDDLQQITQKH